MKLNRAVKLKRGFKLSDEQITAVNYGIEGSSHMFVEARAGTGKTTISLLIAEHVMGKVAYCVFNKKNAVEAEEKMKDKGLDWTKLQIGTVHKFGYKAWRKVYPDSTLNDHKVDDIAETRFGSDETLAPHIPLVVKMVKIAKQRAVGVRGYDAIDDREAWEKIIWHYNLLDEDLTASVLTRVIQAAQRVLNLSNAMTGMIDFSDMIYLPLIHRCRFFRYDVVIVDEYQDTNWTREAVVDQMLKPGGRIMAVGDPHQAIYGFTGADSDSIIRFTERYQPQTFPLTITRRCPKAVVKFANQWVPDLKAAETAPEGEFLTMAETDFLQKRELLVAGNAILCRNTKPLVSLAFKLIRQKIPCNIEGRDIAQQLIRLATKWRRVKTLDELEKKLEEYLEGRRKKLEAKKANNAIAALEDQVECLKAVIEQCLTEGKDQVDCVVEYVETLFADGVDHVLVLSTIHKSKGREWHTVAFYDRAGTCPSPYAELEWQMRQERNLMYVAATRAMNTLIDVTSAESDKPKRIKTAPGARGRSRKA
jgi:DNA helicase II / ATP-dependent DNA helicase PcrA